LAEVLKPSNIQILILPSIILNLQSCTAHLLFWITYRLPQNK